MRYFNIMLALGVALSLSLGLNACGFTPLYQQNTAQLAPNLVRHLIIEGAYAANIAQNLAARVPKHAQGQYDVRVILSETIHNDVIERDGESTRKRLQMRARIITTPTAHNLHDAKETTRARFVEVAYSDRRNALTNLINQDEVRESAKARISDAVMHVLIALNPRQALREKNGTKKSP